MCKCILASDFSDQVWDLVSHKMECLLVCMSVFVCVFVFCTYVYRVASAFH